MTASARCSSSEYGRPAFSVSVMAETLHNPCGGCVCPAFETNITKFLTRDLAGTALNCLMNGAIATAVSGLTASSMWMDAIASNIANTGDSSTVPSTPPTQPIPQNMPATFQPVTVSFSSGANGDGVSAQTTPALPSYTTAYAPSSPSANAQGLVALPNVDLATQFVNMAEATISYRANLAVFRAASQMDKATLNMIA